MKLINKYLPISNRHVVVLLALLWCTIINAEAQSIISSGSFEKATDAYQKNHPHCPFYVHTDKNIYINNESLWFAAYVLGKLPGGSDQHILSLSLFDPTAKKVRLTEKFEISGRFFSSRMIIPDSLPTGRYILIATLDLIDRQGQALAQFTEPITVKNLSKKAFTASLTLLDSNSKAGIVRALLKVAPTDQKSRIIATAGYHVGGLSRSAIPLKNNQLLIEIPQVELKSINPSLTVSVNYAKEAEQLNLLLPTLIAKRIHIRFFPEGGDITDGLLCRVAFEAQTAERKNLAVTGVLVENSTAIANVSTDVYGIGTFEFKPNKSNRYFLKLNAGTYLSRDTLIQLPTVADKPVNMIVRQAVANDTVAIELNCKQAQPLQLLVHNYRGDFAAFELPPFSSRKTFRLPLTRIPKGVAEITLIDGQDRPLAERLFFAHFDDQVIAAVKAEKQKYDKNETVNLEVHLKDRSGKPVQGIFSIAAVQAGRLNMEFRNIEDQCYLVSNLGKVPPNVFENGLYDKAYLENILLTKGWRRYKWQDLIKSNYADTANVYSALAITGKVSFNGKALQKPVNLVSIGSNGIGIIPTKSDGSFTIDPKLLAAPEGKKIVLKVNGDQSSGYHIQTIDPYNTLAENIGNESTNERFGVENNSTTDWDTSKITGVHNLQTVTIRASNRKSSFEGAIGPPGINDCGDYVDEFGYLNYAYSEHRFHPVVGTLYKTRTDLNGQRTSFKVDPAYYNGCPTEGKKDIFQLDGIYGAREFYGVGESLSDSDFLSTLYWKAKVLTDTSGTAKLSFKTGEISDHFRIVIEGVTDGDVFSCSSNFVVK